jgi:predicted O-methyltransferase YrrM
MDRPLIVTAWRGHEIFATWLVKEIQPKVIVELGVDKGYSSFTFALPGIGTVYGVDSFEGDPEAGLRNTYPEVIAKRDELGIKNLELVKGYFSDVAKTWTEPIDILHIDGRHRYEDVKEDFEKITTRSSVSSPRSICRRQTLFAAMDWESCRLIRRSSRK